METQYNKTQPVQSNQHLQVELSKKVDAITKENPNLDYFYHRRQSAFLDIIPKMFLPVKEKLFREHEAKLLETDLHGAQEQSRVKVEYALSALKELANTRLENVKSILRKERGILLVNQLKMMISEIFIEEKEFEKVTIRRDTEIDKLPSAYLNEKARAAWKHKIDTYYDIGNESMQKFRKIIDEELK